jgi:transcriptional regulator with XRE-family HTH domain
MNESRVALGRRIRRLREDVGLTLAQLAEKAELSPKHLGELERGRGNPSLSKMEKLVEALDISLAEIFGCKKSRLPRGKIRIQLYQLIDIASDEQCEVLQRVIKAFLG